MEEQLDTVARSLEVVSDTLERHGEMLAAILEAATKPLPKSDLTKTLERIAAAIDRQTEAIQALAAKMEQP